MSWWDLVRIETVKDMSICSVIVVDHVVNLLLEMEKCVKEECVEKSRSHARFFFFKGYPEEPELLCLLIQSRDWRK